MEQFEHSARQSHPKLPKAYRRGLADFYGREFIVNSDTLIPRPETEAVIDMVLNLLGKPYLPGVRPTRARLPQNLKVLEVGTGSGCIAITLKLEAPELEIVATDISEKALEVAKRNNSKFNTKIKLEKSDLLENVTFSPDLVIANLPYVDRKWEWIDEEALSYEPSIALYAENHGLELIYKLITQTARYDICNLILEADPCQHGDIMKFAKDNGYSLNEKRGFILYYTKQ